MTLSDQLATAPPLPRQRARPGPCTDCSRGWPGTFQDTLCTGDLGAHGCVRTQTCQREKARGPGGDRGGQDHGFPDTRATLLTPGVPSSQVALRLPMALGSTWLPEKEPPALRGSGTGHTRHWECGARIRLDRAPRPSPDPAPLQSPEAMETWWLKGSVCSWALFAGVSPDGPFAALLSRSLILWRWNGDPKITSTQNLRAGPRLETGPLKM